MRGTSMWPGVAIVAYSTRITRMSIGPDFQAHIQSHPWNFQPRSLVPYALCIAIQMEFWLCCHPYFPLPIHCIHASPIVADLMLGGVTAGGHAGVGGK